MSEDYRYEVYDLDCAMFYIGQYHMSNDEVIVGDLDAL